MRYSLASTLASINRLTDIAPYEPVAEVLLASVLASFDPAAESPRLVIVGHDAELLVDLIGGWEAAQRVTRFVWPSSRPDRPHHVDGPGYVVNDRGWLFGSRNGARTTLQHFEAYRWVTAENESRGYGDRYTVARAAVIAFLDERIAMLTDGRNFPYGGASNDRAFSLSVIVEAVRKGGNAMRLSTVATDLAQYLAFIRDRDGVTESEYQIAFRFVMSQLSRIDGAILHALIANGGEAMTISEIAYATGIDYEAIIVAIRQRPRKSGVVRCLKRGVYALRSDLRRHAAAVRLEPLRVDAKAARSFIETRGLVV